MANAGPYIVQPGCSSPTDGVVIDWWAPPSPASVTPEGRPTRIGWPPRQMRNGPGRAPTPEPPPQAGPGDAQLEVLAVRAFAPVQDGLGVVGEPVDALAGRPHADLVHPAAEVGRRRDVRRQRDHALRGVRRGAGEVEQGASERGLGGGVPARGAADVDREGGRG